MAMRAAPPPFSSPSSHFTKSLIPKPSSFLSKPSPNVKSILISTALLTSTVTPPQDVNAFTLPKDQIITSLTKVESTIERIQEVGTGVLDFSQNSFNVVINLALPVLQKSGDQALKIASPVIEGVSKKTQEVIGSSGVDAEPIYRVAKNVGNIAGQTFEVIAGAKPIALSALEALLKAEPIVIAEASGGLIVTYLILPPIWSAVSYNIRGYKGKLSPPQTLDLLSRRNYFMIDIRLQNEKNSAGVPLLPSAAKNKKISIPAEELPSKIKVIVRNSKKAEAAIAALKISHLKMINEHSNIVIMDSYCDMAKTVARELTDLGFKNCWVMAGGFSGSQGWSESYLGKKTYNVSSAEILPPSRDIFPTAKKLQSEDETSS